MGYTEIFWQIGTGSEQGIIRENQGSCAGNGELQEIKKGWSRNPSKPSLLHPTERQPAGQFFKGQIRRLSAVEDGFYLVGCEKGRTAELGPRNARSD